MNAETDASEHSEPVQEVRDGFLPAKLVPTLLVFVLILSAALRLVGLRDYPHWYSDELFNLKVIQDLLQGEMRVRALTWTGFSPFHPYPLGYHAVGAVFCFMLGDDIWTLRLMCGLIGVATTFFVFLSGRAIYDDRAGLLAAVAYAIHPKIVLFTRWAFPQNLSPLFVTAAVWAGLRYYQSPQRNWLIAFSLLVGGSFISIYWAAPLGLFLLGVVFTRNRRHLAAAIGLSLAPLFVQFLIALAVHGSDAVFYDISRLIALRIAEADAPAGGVLDSIRRALDGYWSLFFKDQFFVFGILGLLFLPVRWHTAALVTVLGLLSLSPVMQRGKLVADFFYSTVFFVPIALMGFGAFFSGLLHYAGNIKDVVRRNCMRFATLGLTLCVLGFGWFLLLRQTVALDTGRWSTRLDTLGFTVSRHEDLEAAARYINHRTGPEDLVIATPNLPWLIQAQCTGVHQFASRLPGSTIWYPKDIPDSRYLYELDIERTRFLVVDNLTLMFYITVRNCDEVLYRIHKERWPLVEQFGEFLIYSNPRHVSSQASTRPILAPRLQLKLAIGYERRDRPEEATKWYGRALNDGGPPLLQFASQVLSTNPGLALLRQAVEEDRRRKENQP